MDTDTTQKENKQTNYTLIAINAALAVCVISFAGMIYFAHQDSARALAAEILNPRPNPAAFDSLALSAKSALVWDPTTGSVLYSKDSDTVRPLASLTKLMTAVTALSILPKNSTVSIPPQALEVEGNSGLYADEQWSLTKLLQFSLVVSSNDGAASIAAAAGAFNPASQSAAVADSSVQQSDYGASVSTFVADMNTEAVKLGFPSLHFNNPTGLDQNDGSNGGQGTASDMAKLFAYAYKNYPEIFADTSKPSDNVSSLDYIHQADNTDLAVSDIPGMIAGKTGTTDLAGGNLAVMIDAGLDHPIVIVVLGSTDSGRFTDVEALASSTLAYLQGN